MWLIQLLQIINGLYYAYIHTHFIHFRMCNDLIKPTDISDYYPLQ